jgi:hypothetical protein
MTETQLREDVRKALVAYRDHLRETLNSNVVREHALVSHTQVESAMRVLWMENC